MYQHEFWMTAKFDSECAECGGDIEAGSRIVYDPDDRLAYCGECGEDIAGEDKKEKGKGRVKE